MYYRSLTMNARIKVMLAVMVVTAGLYADQEAGFSSRDRIHEGKHRVTRVAIVTTSGPLTLLGRALQVGANREPLTLVQVRDDQRTLHEMIVAVDQSLHGLKPFGRPREAGVAIWVWGTSTGLAVAGEGLGRVDDTPPDLSQLPLGLARLSEKDWEGAAALEALVGVDLGKRFVLLLYDESNLVGVRFLSTDPNDDPQRLAQLSFDLLAKQKMGFININGNGFPPPSTALGGVASPDEGGIPQAMCCVTCGDKTCCCTSPNGCTNGPSGPNCDNEITCSCTGPNSCRCTGLAK
jgi:hypothetical protein